MTPTIADIRETYALARANGDDLPSSRAGLDAARAEFDQALAARAVRPDSGRTQPRPGLDPEDPITHPNLTPNQGLFLEVLAARTRGGERQWTFDKRHTPTAKALAAAGLITWRPGIVQDTILAALTTEGRTYLSPTYVLPVVAAFAEAAETLAKDLEAGTPVIPATATAQRVRALYTT